ncbi:helix-hairpin-helix domain-containing protein [Neolewinella agarilytica]|uniref:DNA uptake protein ComE n=1 Tax=Neolewinella agarilytica TaxID=478744 RepID=A0A1H8Z7C3_9BACT|nr:helix-hairpin-helix domain-containing protein [Neolewinella agarilytica]SEP60334.1 DNA uptake protein ComE [Neolewinella agarilytica]
MDYRLGAYPRNQRLALLAVLIVAVGCTWLTDFGLSFGDHASASSVAAASSLRQSLMVQERQQFGPVPEAFAFDPNTVSREELIRLGLSDKQALSWLKFRGNRQNAFKSPEEIGKLFVLSRDDKARLIPLAYVADTAKKRARPQVQSFAFDPNTVSAQDLERLGLSPKQAVALINYRSKAKYGRAFRKAEDLRRLGTLSDQQKDHLIGLAEIPPEEPEPVVAALQFSFDPNTISADSFQLLGFPAWQAKSLLRYRGDRAITFRRATDLRRVKSLDSALVEAVIPLVRLAPPTSTAPAAAPTTYTYKPKVPPPPPGSVDINTADTSVWKSIPGIGSYRAKRIVRFREVLGGFVSVNQVGETRGLPDSTFQAIMPYLKASPVPRPLVINRATYDELKRHPYINRNLANSIVKNREKFGRFNGPEDLRRLRLITDKNLPTLLPYFSFE